MIADDVAAAYADRDAALERLGAVGEELRVLRRLHEVGTDRTAGLAAVIEKAKATIGDVNEQWKPLVLADILASADTDAALREVRAVAIEDVAERITKRWSNGRQKFVTTTNLDGNQLRRIAAEIREGAKTDG